MQKGLESGAITKEDIANMLAEQGDGDFEKAEDQFSPQQWDAMIALAGIDVVRQSFARIKKGKARGAIVTKPAYLPASGTVVGEHASWSGGKSAAVGGFAAAPPKTPDGGDEAIIPLDGQRGGSILADALAPSVTGAVLNQMQMERVGMDTAVASAAPTIVDSSTNTQVFNETNIRNPSVDSPHVFGESTDKLIRMVG
jgi:hypothetical protein